MLLCATAAARANVGTIRSCKPGDRSFALSVRAKGVSCNEARGIERYAAHHDWVAPFRLYHRRWRATVYSHAHHHTYVRFGSGRLTVFITIAKAFPKGGRPIGTGDCTLKGEHYGGVFAGRTPVATPSGDREIDRVYPGEQVISIDASGRPVPKPIVLVQGGDYEGYMGVVQVRPANGDDLRQLIVSRDVTFANGEQGLRLVPGDELPMLDGSRARVVSLRLALWSGRAVQLQVSGPTGMVSVNGVLAHSSC
jgi:hypothetical protein